MQIEPIRLLIHATQSGSHIKGQVPAGYAVRILGGGLDKVLFSGRQISEVQAMYAFALEAAFNYLLVELSDAVLSTNPKVEIVVKSPGMSARFQDADNSLFEKAITGETTATANIDTWLASAAIATHFQPSFRQPEREEKQMLKEVEQIAKGQAHKCAHSKERLGSPTW